MKRAFQCFDHQLSTDWMIDQLINYYLRWFEIHSKFERRSKTRNGSIDPTKIDDKKDDYLN